MIDVLRDAILQNIGPLKDAPKQWRKRCCFLCHTRGFGIDRRYRLGIQFNDSTIIVNCFNCGFSAVYSEGDNLSFPFKKFLSHINISEAFIAKLSFDIFTARFGSASNSVVEPKVAQLQYSKWVAADLPKDSLPISEWLSAGLEDPDFLNVVSYALSRKIYDLDKFYWSPTKAFNLNERLIIPYYYRKKIVGFTSRLSYEPTSKFVPKYYQQLPADFVYNLDNQQSWDRKYVIVNEGVLDAWNTDGVATLGEINQSKIDTINRLQKEIIVCPDRDKKGGDLVKAAIANNWKVSYPVWEPGIKDASAAANRYGRILTIKSIIDSAISDSVEVLVNWDTWQLEREKHKIYE